MGLMGKQPKTCQQKGNGLSPSVTSTYYPLNNYPQLTSWASAWRTSRRISSLMLRPCRAHAASS
jgi:hypothetical protein